MSTEESDSTPREAAEPRSAEAWLELAVQQHRGGAFDTALRLYEKALELDGNLVPALNNLAAISTLRGDLERSEQLLRRAIDLAPDHANAYNNLGRVFERQEQWPQAEACYNQALQLDPNHASARNNLGNIRKARGDLRGAVECYLEAQRLLPNEPTILGNIGNCLLELGQLQDAETCFRAGLELAPTSAELHNGLGRVFQADGDAARAVEAYRVALQHDPALRVVHNNLGVSLLELNRTAEARRSFQTALTLDPDDLAARLNYALGLPILYRTTQEIHVHRTHVLRELGRLCDDLLRSPPPEGARAVHRLDVFSRHTNFYAQYQGQDDLELQQKYASLLIHATSSVYPPIGERRSSPRERLRVGFISAFLRDHTVGKLVRGFVEHHDPRQLEVYTYYLGYEVQPLTRVFQKHSAVFRHLPQRLETLVTILRRDALDVLIFADVGMTPVLSTLAAARVAPVQCAFWGHPITTGLPTVDVFITSADMEPELAERHYSEQLLRLPGVGICYARPELPPLTRSRADFGLGDTDVVYLSCQSLYKYLPAWDALFPAIATEVPAARFVFLRHPRAAPVTELFRERLGLAFDQAGLRMSDFCRFLPHLTQDDYFALNRCSDVFLDTPSWSGGNTTLEALACGLPVVTLPGAFMRARHAFAMLKGLELNDCIASDEADYVRTAVALGLDEARRSAVRDRIQARADQVLFSQVSCVRALEAELQRLCRVG